MEKTKKENRDKSKEKIIVIDEGVSQNDMATERKICCFVAMFAFRG